LAIVPRCYSNLYLQRFIGQSGTGGGGRRKTIPGIKRRVEKGALGLSKNPCLHARAFFTVPGVLSVVQKKKRRKGDRSKRKKGR